MRTFGGVWGNVQGKYKGNYVQGKMSREHNVQGTSRENVWGNVQGSGTFQLGMFGVWGTSSEMFGGTYRSPGERRGEYVMWNVQGKTFREKCPGNVPGKCLAGTSRGISGGP